MLRGKFITFEGGEGCGKSTQVARLKDALEREGVRVVVTREPGGTAMAEKVRAILKDPSGDSPCDRAELLLFLAARAQLVNKVIRPALAEGAWVVSDRFSDSTLAYQGYGRGLPLEFIRAANAFACEDLQPDLTLLFEVSPEVASARMRSREQSTGVAADRIELAGDAFHERLRRGFADLADAEPQRFVRIDAGLGIEEVWEQVWKSLRPLR